MAVKNYIKSGAFEDSGCPTALHLEVSKSVDSC